MKFLAVTALFAAGALAHVLPGPISADKIASSCPSDNRKCCAQKSKSGDSVSQEEQKSLLHLLSLDQILLPQTSAARYDDCETLVGPINQCTNFVACCAGANAEGSQKGLVNIACLAVPVSV